MCLLELRRFLPRPCFTELLPGFERFDKYLTLILMGITGFFFLTNGKKKIKEHEIKWVRLMAGPQRQRADGVLLVLFFFKLFFFQKKKVFRLGDGEEKLGNFGFVFFCRSRVKSNKKKGKKKQRKRFPL